MGHIDILKEMNHLYGSSFAVTVRAAPVYSYMPVLYTLICRSCILPYAGFIYSYMPVLYTLICRSFIVL